MTVAITVGLLMFGAVYLFSKRELLRVILGMVLLATPPTWPSSPRAAPTAAGCPSRGPQTSRCRPMPCRRPSS
mgnify:CR=1 FL=1